MSMRYGCKDWMPRVQITFVGDKGMTKQEFAAEVDINRIVANYEKNGMVPMNLSVGQPFFGDVSAVPDYQTALNMVREADEHFNMLPARVRARFGNDPKEMINFLEDPKNVDEAVEMGLVTKRPAPEPAKVHVVNEPVVHSKEHSSVKKGKSSKEDD